MSREAKLGMHGALRPQRRLRRRPARRRGITLIIVMMLISITMALSYAMVRSQISAVQIQNNSSRRDLSYQSALTGISAALRKMSNNSWAGVDTTLSGSLTQYDTYQVTFTTGDSSLTPGSANYSDYPYRVTLLSTGSSVDPAHGTTTTRRIQAVVRLIVAQLGAETSEWPAMQQFTAYQTNTKPFTLNVPCRIEGPVRVQGAVTICPDYSWPTANPFPVHERLDGHECGQFGLVSPADRAGELADQQHRQLDSIADD